MDGRLAWILTGGYDGHQPARVAAIVADTLGADGFDVQVVTTLDVLDDPARLRVVDLIVPNWTMGTISPGALAAWLAAVREGGTGVAGVHGGMADAFRSEPAYHEMVGGQWVAHPGGDGVTYEVQIVKGHPLAGGLQDFTVTSEQYYLHVDPGIDVLATTRFGAVVMPVAWTKTYGRGRVFYCSVGHQPELLERDTIRSFIARGFSWAARTSGGRMP